MYFGATPFAAAPFSDVGFSPNAYVNVVGSRINESTGNPTLIGKALVLPTGNRLNFTIGNIEIAVNQTVSPTGQQLNLSTGYLQSSGRSSADINWICNCFSCS